MNLFLLWGLKMKQNHHIIGLTLTLRIKYKGQGTMFNLVKLEPLSQSNSLTVHIEISLILSKNYLPKLRKENKISPLEFAD